MRFNVYLKRIVLFGSINCSHTHTHTQYQGKKRNKFGIWKSTAKSAAATVATKVTKIGIALTIESEKEEC